MESRLETQEKEMADSAKAQQQCLSIVTDLNETLQDARESYA